MKKVLVTVFSSMFILLVACASNEVDDSTTEKYISKTKEIIILLNEGSYEKVHTMFDDKIKTELTIEEMIDEFTPILEHSGDFKNYDKSSIKRRDDYHIVQIAGEYSNESRVFTVTFNNDDEIAGLYIN